MSATATLHDATVADTTMRPPADPKMAQAPEDIVDIELSRISISEPFKGLFDVEADTLAGIVDSMRKRGFDRSEPVVLWSDDNVLVDGHRRVAAAMQAGLTTVASVRKSFGDEREALLYAIRRQVGRRNIGDARLYELVLQFDQRDSHGGDRRSAESRTKASAEVLIRSSEKTAAMLGTSRSKVEKVRAIHDSQDQAIIDQVKDGALSLNAACERVRRFNRAVIGSEDASPAMKARTRDSSTKSADLPDALPQICNPEIEAADARSRLATDQGEAVTDASEKSSCQNLGKLKFWSQVLCDLRDEMRENACRFAQDVEELRLKLEAEIVSVEQEGA